MNNSFYSQFLNADDLSLHKWHHYYPIYEKHFGRFQNKAIKFLEIGVQQGGSAHLFRRILGDGCHVVGIDIDQRSKDAEIVGQVDIEIGDQTDRHFLKEIAEKYGPFDIILDDGGHTLNQIWTSYDVLFPYVKDKGVYLIEDVHAQFWSRDDFRDDPQQRTIFDFVNHLQFALHEDTGRFELFSYWHLPEDKRVNDLSHQGMNRYIKEVSLYDSIIAIEKEKREAPFSEIRNPIDSYNFERSIKRAEDFDQSKEYQALERGHVNKYSVPRRFYNKLLKENEALKARIAALESANNKRD